MSQDPSSCVRRETYPDKHTDSLQGVSCSPKTRMRENDRCVTCGLCVGLMRAGSAPLQTLHFNAGGAFCDLAEHGGLKK